MAKDESSTVTPRLRFPDFRGHAGWKRSPLRDRGTFLRGLTYGATDVDNGGLLVLRSANIQHGNLVFDSDLVFVRKNCPPDLRLHPGDIAVCMSNGSKALVGKSAEYKGGYAGPVTVGAFCSIFRPSMPFVKLAFRTERYTDFVASAIGGGNINNLKNSDLEAFEFAVPGAATEREKITDCLTSLDQVIAAQGRKVQALKAQKRALMQQFFPREGEFLPRLRFPEFRDEPDWEKRTLGELASIVRGGSPRPIDGFLTGESNGLNWLKIGDVDREAKYITNTAERVRPEALSKTRVIHPGDFILSNSMSFGRPYISRIETCIHDGWIAVTNIPANLSREFLYYSISSESSQTYFADQAAGGGVQNLNTEIVKSLPTVLPGEREQAAIAGCLASLDEVSVAESQRLVDLKTHRTGLMQQLFPSPEGD